jgi:serine/threonine protein phosphatase PrpC
MAGTDVFGILSLLLAAAVAAYLVWARLLRPPTRQDAAPPPAGDRTAETLPPVLRPPSEISPKMLAKQEAKARSASSRPPRSPAGKKKTVSVRPDKPAEDGKATPAVPKDKVASVAPSSDPAPSASKRPQKAESQPPAPPPASAAEASPEPVAPPASPEPVAPPATPSTASRATDDIPRFDAEDEEDLEPTKIGSLVKAGAIQPIVEKIVFDEGADEAAPPTTEPLLVVYSLAQTDPGRRRKQNEDSLLVMEEQSVFVVADGMGGHRGGQHASKLAVKTISHAFEHQRFESAPHEGIPRVASELARSMQMANSAIFREAKGSTELTGMGTTLCAAKFSEDKQRLYLGHVGDSRCYRLRDGVMKQMTADHTMANHGVAGPEGAHLSRALGVWPTVPIDIVMAAPKLGDIYLLCSDGLTKMVPDGTIATQLLHEEDPKAAVERLVFFANAHGGKDNITVILLRVVEPGWTPPTPSS